MTARTWLFRTILTILAAIGIVVITSYAIDPFGIWRDPSGRKLAIYFDQGKSKFLMNKRYVPTNFNGLLIGSSATSRWDLPSVGGIRIFNESLSGANAADEDTLVSQATSHQHYKLALVMLSPFMTRTHDIKEGMDSTKVTEALGSLAVIENELGLALASAHIHTRDNDLAPNGQVIPHVPRNLNPDFYDASHYDIDPIALDKYRSIIQSLQSGAAQIIYVVPPMYEPCYELNKPGMDAYTVTIRGLLPPAPIIDLSDAKYASLRSDSANFVDCVHLEKQGADKFVPILSDRLKQLLPAS